MGFIRVRIYKKSSFATFISIAGSFALIAAICFLISIFSGHLVVGIIGTIAFFGLSLFLALWAEKIAENQLMDLTPLQRQENKYKALRRAHYTLLVTMLLSLIIGFATIPDTSEPPVFDQFQNNGEYSYIEAKVILDFAQSASGTNSSGTKYYLIQTIDGSYCIAEIYRITDEMKDIYVSQTVDILDTQKSLILYGYGKEIPKGIVELYVNDTPGAEEGKFDSDTEFFSVVGKTMFKEGSKPLGVNDVFLTIFSLSSSIFFPVFIIFLVSKSKLKKLRVKESEEHAKLNA